MSTNPEYSIRENRMQAASDIRSRRSGHPLQAVRDVIAVALRRIAQRGRLRRDLERLDARQLHDIGVSREELECEAAKPFWRP